MVADDHFVESVMLKRLVATGTSSEEDSGITKEDRRPLEEHQAESRLVFAHEKLFDQAVIRDAFSVPSMQRKLKRKRVRQMQYDPAGCIRDGDCLYACLLFACSAKKPTQSQVGSLRAELARAWKANGQKLVEVAQTENLRPCQYLRTYVHQGWGGTLEIWLFSMQHRVAFEVVDHRNLNLCTVGSVDWPKAKLLYVPRHYVVLHPCTMASPCRAVPGLCQPLRGGGKVTLRPKAGGVKDEAEDSFKYGYAKVPLDDDRFSEASDRDAGDKRSSSAHAVFEKDKINITVNVNTEGQAVHRRRHRRVKKEQYPGATPKSKPSPQFTAIENYKQKLLETSKRPRSPMTSDEDVEPEGMQRTRSGAQFARSKQAAVPRRQARVEDSKPLEDDVHYDPDLPSEEELQDSTVAVAMRKERRSRSGKSKKDKKTKSKKDRRDDEQIDKKKKQRKRKSRDVSPCTPDEEAVPDPVADARQSADAGQSSGDPAPTLVLKMPDRFAMETNPPAREADDIVLAWHRSYKMNFCYGCRKWADKQHRNSQTHSKVVLWLWGMGRDERRAHQIQMLADAEEYLRMRQIEQDIRLKEKLRGGGGNTDQSQPDGPSSSGAPASSVGGAASSQAPEPQLSQASVPYMGGGSVSPPHDAIWLADDEWCVLDGSGEQLSGGDPDDEGSDDSSLGQLSDDDNGSTGSGQRRQHRIWVRGPKAWLPIISCEHTFLEALRISAALCFKVSSGS